MNLPKLIYLADYEAGDYINVVYEKFKHTIAERKLTFLGLPVICPWHPPTDNKHACFWHLISTGTEEEKRIPEITRCERILWVAYIIRNANNHREILCWEKVVKTSRGRSTHIALYLPSEKYLVILRKKTNRLELITAYVKSNDRTLLLEHNRNPDPRYAI